MLWFRKKSIFPNKGRAPLKKSTYYLINAIFIVYTVPWIWALYYIARHWSSLPWYKYLIVIFLFFTTPSLDMFDSYEKYLKESEEAAKKKEERPRFFEN